jgi:DNA (cytosine-5)-methyltransferase 1
LDIPAGTPSGNGVTRARRAALGNCLDVRLAQIVWERVLYLYSLIKNA